MIGGGLSDELSQATFSVGLKGVKPQDVEAVEKLVHESLKQFATDGTCVCVSVCVCMYVCMYVCVVECAQVTACYRSIRRIDWEPLKIIMLDQRLK